MPSDNDLLAEQLKQELEAQGRPTAFDGAPSADAPEAENPLETDFFKALNAFRAARAKGDANDIAAAERHFQEVVRGELTGTSCAPAAEE